MSSVNYTTTEASRKKIFPAVVYKTIAMHVCLYTFLLRRSRDAKQTSHQGQFLESFEVSIVSKRKCLGNNDES